MKKILRWTVPLAIVALLAVIGWRYQRARTAPEVNWKTVPAEKRRLAAKVTASGTLQATVTVQVGAQVSGRIQKLSADFNTTVKKGQLLVKLDPQLYQAAVEQANANFLLAQASVAKAEAQERDAQLGLSRTKSLSNEALASAAELQTAVTNVAVAKATTEAAKASLALAGASLRQARVNLSYTEIFSPIDGTVISRAVDVGQTVAASLQAPVLFTIAEDLRTMQVHTNVAEGDVGRLEPAMAVTFTVDAFPGQTFKGKVGQIRNAPQTVQNVVTYDAVIDVDNTDLRLRPGMTATVTIVYAEREDALTVPNAALRFRLPPELASSYGILDPASSNSATPAAAASARRGRPGGPSAGGAESAAESRTLYVLRGAMPERVRVTTGLSDGSMTEILHGELAPGDALVTDVTVNGKPSAAAPNVGGGGAPRMGRMF